MDIVLHTLWIMRRSNPRQPRWRDGTLCKVTVEVIRYTWTRGCQPLRRQERGSLRCRDLTSMRGQTSGDIRDDLGWTSQDDEALGPLPSHWEPRRSISRVMMQKPTKENESSAPARLMQIKRACGDRPVPIDSWGRGFVASVDGWRQLSRRSLSWTQVKEHRKGYDR